jgi:hypothetical protein
LILPRSSDGSSLSACSPAVAPAACASPT